MQKICVTADSTVDLSTELLEKNHIRIQPLYINLDGTYYKDGVDIFPDKIYDYVESTGKVSKTAAASIEDYTQLFTDALKEYAHVIHINISSEFSSAHQNACIAAQEIGNVSVIDSRNLSTGSGLIALEACEMIAQGLPAETIVTNLNALTAKVDASFVIDTLKYLHKGGRCSSVTALGANVLKLKPCINVIDGKMDVGKKYRGALSGCLKNYVTDRLANRTDINTKRIFITHTKCDDALIQLVREEITKHFTFDEVLETTAGCTITNHCGPGTLGILFIRK